MRKKKRLQSNEKVSKSKENNPVQEFLTGLDKAIKTGILFKILDCLEETEPINYNPDTYFNDAGTTWDLIGGYYLKLVKPSDLEVSKCAAHFYEWKNEIFSEFTKEEIQEIFLSKLSLEEAKLAIQNKLNNE